MKQQSITANSQTTIMATQAVIMRDTLPQMQAQASAAVEAAHAEATSAAAAKQAAQTAKDTLYLTESPDIEVQIECSTQAFGLDTRLTLHYRNAGRTRAVGFAQAFNPGFPAIRPFINHTTSIGPLSAGSTKPSGTTPTVREMLQYFKPTVTPEKAFQDIRSGTMAFSFWGIATYKDMLNNPHTFEFQYEWDRVWPNKCDFILVKADAN